MVINPIDAQIMMLNQTIVGKEQQVAKELPVQIMNEEVEKFAKERKEDTERVVKSPESEQQQKINEKNQRQQSNQKKQKDSEKQKLEKEEERKKIEHQVDILRGRIIDITL